MLALAVIGILAPCLAFFHLANAQGFPSSLSDTLDVVDFNGVPFTYNASSIVRDKSFLPRNPKVSERSLTSRLVTNDDCGASSFGGIDSPWSNIADCRLISQFYRNLNTPQCWIEVNQGFGFFSQAQLVGSVPGCQLFASVLTFSTPAYIGCSDMADIVDSSIAILGGNNLVGATGCMTCLDTLNKQSYVRWNLVPQANGRWLEEEC